MAGYEEVPESEIGDDPNDEFVRLADYLAVESELAALRSRAEHAGKLADVLRRLSEKTARANNLQHSRPSRTLLAEDWSELYALSNEAEAVLDAWHDAESARAALAEFRKLT
jgi:hypothetical protein